MGREIKRVALDFNWPLNKTWEGYLNPHPYADECKACGGSGYSSLARVMSDQWYGKLPFHPEEYGVAQVKPEDLRESVTQKILRSEQDGTQYYRYGKYTLEEAIVAECYRMWELTKNQWCHHLSQEDVDALVEAERLRGFTHVPRNQEQADTVQKKLADGGNSWLPEPNGYRPTNTEVNQWSYFGFGHDSINRWICVKARCERSGIKINCDACDGEGHVWESQGAKKLYEEWEAVEPPEGEGWQVWETVSEGSPITPVMPTSEALVDYLSSYGDLWCQNRGDSPPSREACERFVKSGFAMSAIVHNGTVKSGIEAAT